MLKTDAKLFGAFDMQTMSSMGRNEQIIDELQKQYDVVQVDPTNPITEKYDVLLAVQPSSLGPDADEELHRRGQSRPADGDLRGSVPATGRRRAGHERAKQPPGGGNPFACSASRRSPRATSRAVEAVGRGLRRR